MLKFQKAWKFYFWFSLVGFFAGLVLELKMEATESNLTDTLLSIATYVVEVIALVCLYGFAWQLKVGNKLFWAVFFFVSVGFFGYTVGYEFWSGVEELIEAGYFIYFLLGLMFLLLAPQFLANYLYAFRSKHLWANAP
jgi:hypothetical protein